MEADSNDLSIAPETSPAVEDLPLPDVEDGLVRTRSPLLYRFSLMAVALAMVLLPLVYLAIIGLFGWSVWYYAVHCYSILSWHAGFRGFIFLLMLYFGPLLAGGVLIFFLIKPIFAPARDVNESLSLDHADAPQLFALIGWICRSLGAPIPSRIDVNCVPNASAGFRAGLRSIFGNDIVLTIGLPLVAGLDLGKFAGVIAHEYGHFSQGTGMRAGYLISRINGWFYRVVYERDAWDDALVRSCEDDDQDARIKIILYLARASVWFGRGILWILMAIGNLLSAFMSRQMEFDADRYEIKLAGTENFIATFRRIQQLNAGMELALHQIITQWKKERKLFDRLPEFVASRADNIPAEIQGRLYASAARRKTGLFDSHPSDAERIRRAIKAAEPGILHGAAPASGLFADFNGLSRRVTLHFYQCWLGSKFKPDFLVSAGPLSGEEGHDATPDMENVHRYFLGICTILRPFAIPENKHKPLAFRGPDVLGPEILASRRRMQELLPDAQAAFVEFEAADNKSLIASQALQLLQAGFAFSPTDAGFESDDLDRIQDEALQNSQAAAALEPFDTAARARLTDAIQLLSVPQIIRPIPEAPRLRDEARELLWTLSRLTGIFPTLLELRRDCAALAVLLQYRASGQPADNLAFTLETLCTGIQERVNQIQEHTSRVRHPFPQTAEPALLNEHLRNKEYHADPAELTLREGTSHVEKITALYWRLLGALVIIAERVESSLAPE